MSFITRTRVSLPPCEQPLKRALGVDALHRHSPPFPICWRSWVGAHALICTNSSQTPLLISARRLQGFQALPPRAVGSDGRAGERHMLAFMVAERAPKYIA